MNTHIIGDPAIFYRDGVGETWGRRRILALSNYGVHRLVHTVEMSGIGAITVEISGGPRAVTVTHVIDSAEHPQVAHGASSVSTHRYVALWEGGALVTRSVR